MKEQYYNVDLRDVVMSYQKEKDTKAAEIILEVTKNRRENYIYRLYGYYGAQELKYNDFSKEAMDHELCAITLDRVRNSFVVDPDLSPSEFRKNFHSYVGCSMQDVKQVIEKDINGITHHYAAMLMRMKKNGHDLWDTSDDILCQDIVECKPQTKDTRKALAKLRDMFSARKVFLEDIKEELANTPAVNQDIAMAELMSTLRSVSTMCSEEEWEIFYRHIVEGKANGNPVSRKELGIEYGMTPYEVSKAINKVLKYVRDALSDDYLENAVELHDISDKSHSGRRKKAKAQ